MHKHNQTQEKHIPSDPNQRGVAFVIVDHEFLPSKEKHENVTYAHAQKLGEDQHAFLFIPYGAEIKLPDGTQTILSTETFKI